MYPPLSPGRGKPEPAPRQFCLYGQYYQGEGLGPLQAGIIDEEEHFGSYYFGTLSLS